MLHGQLIGSLRWRNTDQFVGHAVVTKKPKTYLIAVHESGTFLTWDITAMLQHLSEGEKGMLPEPVNFSSAFVAAWKNWKHLVMAAKQWQYPDKVNAMLWTHSTDRLQSNWGKLTLGEQRL